MPICGISKKAFPAGNYKIAYKNKQYNGCLFFLHGTDIHFSVVTEKPLSYSKDTLLISGEINNPSINGLELVLLFQPESIVC